MLNIQEIDGGEFEGGGQIVRMSISLSAVLNIPVRVKNIRARRSKPGLSTQNLKGIQLVAEMCRGKLKGDFVGSSEIEFIPGRIRGGHYVADTKTAGAVSLLLQAALPCALFADGEVLMDLRGGTHVDMAPQVDYADTVLRSNLNRFGADFDMKIRKRGFFPRGGGHVLVEVTPVTSLQPITLLERGHLQDVSGVSFVSGKLPVKLAYDIARSARLELSSWNQTLPVNISSYKEEQSMDSSSGIVLRSSWSSGCVLGGSALGGRGARAGSAPGARAAEELIESMRGGACLDQHAQDQLIVFMCLSGRSRVLAGELTSHTRTAMYVAEELAGVKFNITPQGDENIIECNGVGFINKSIHTE